MSGIGLIVSLSFANNLVLVYALGVGPALASSRKFEVAAGFAVAVMLVLPLVTALSFVVAVALTTFAAEVFSLLLSLLLVVSLLSLAERYLRHHRPKQWQTVGVFLPLLTLNSAVAASVTLGMQQPNSLLQAFGWGLGLGAGLAGTSVMLAGLRERIASHEVPQSFAGIPIALITLGIMSLGFLGFAGMAK